jgi:outer membrane protein OmpA-like peptidoglycan-associated protein
MRKTYRLPVLVAALATTLPGCVTMQELGSNYGQQLGCVTGLVAGTLIGKKLGDDSKGALIGAGIGTAIGCYAGSVWQSRMQALEAVAKEENLSISVEPLQNKAAPDQPKDAGLVAQVQDGSMFSTGSSKLTADGRRKVQKLAAAFAQELSEEGNSADRRLLVVGHTDATGSAALNQRLSEKRARAVGQVLQKAGIPANRIYYQGAGSSRPIADNATQQGRSQNRRVEINEVASEELLVQRINAESANAKYLAFGTTTKSAPAKSASSVNLSKTTTSTAGDSQTTAKASKPPRAATTSASLAKVDFGGLPSQQATQDIVSSIKPKSGGFAFISSAHASEVPIHSCNLDAPRESGRVLSLANGKPLTTHKTREFLPGYNNKVWANTVNGHLVTISPVSILKENADIAKQPFLEVVEGYEAGNRKAGYKLSATANTFEGEDKVLYRVFTSGNNAPISCIDVVFEKGDAKASEGQLFYPTGSDKFVAKFIPIKA